MIPVAALQSTKVPINMLKTLPKCWKVLWAKCILQPSLPYGVLRKIVQIAQHSVRVLRGTDRHQIATDLMKVLEKGMNGFNGFEQLRGPAQSLLLFFPTWMVHPLR